MSRLAALALVLALLPSAAAAEVRLPTGPDLKGQGWTRVGFPGLLMSAYIGHGEEGIEAVAEDSSALLLIELPVDAEVGLMLRWSWRIAKAPPPADLAVDGEDDRPLAVHVWFPDSPKRPSNFGQMIGRSLLGLPPSGRVLTYVWGGKPDGPKSFPAPYSRGGLEGTMIVLRPGNGPAGVWYEEAVDLYADFQAVFGEDPPLPTHFAISADSDDKGGRSEAWIKDIRFSFR